ncbi:MAG: TetR/AcrR family transcriptional regulator [Nitriliruptorales bacterium]|nr:TetR/AcrR family transcriptional regulator [Nitriliruptorales bacterium]
MTDDTRARTYHSPLRELQAQRTRHAILEAGAQIIDEDGLVDFSMRDVAERAGVSERTVYNHFANRQALLDGLADYVDDRLRELDLQSDPRDVDDFTPRIVAIMKAFEDIGAPARAMARLTTAQGTRSSAARERTQQFRERFAHVLDRLPDNEADRAFAILRHVVSSTTWLALRDEFDLDPHDAAEAIGWALDTLLRDLDGRAG